MCLNPFKIITDLFSPAKQEAPPAPPQIIVPPTPAPPAPPPPAPTVTSEKPAQVVPAAAKTESDDPQAGLRRGRKGLRIPLSTGSAFSGGSGTNIPKG